MNAIPLTWLEVDVPALQHNAAAFKARVGEECVFAPVVKSNGTATAWNWPLARSNRGRIGCVYTSYPKPWHCETTGLNCRSMWWDWFLPRMLHG